jgi:hypothetical protein
MLCTGRWSIEKTAEEGLRLESQLVASLLQNGCFEPRQLQEASRSALLASDGDRGTQNWLCCFSDPNLTLLWLSVEVVHGRTLQ